MRFCSLLITVLFLTKVNPFFSQQDQLFTQFWNVATSYNPANSGLQFKQQASVNYRNQWVGITGAPKTFLATYNMKIDKIKSGIGVNYKYETIGFMKQNRFDLNYSYHIDLGEEQKLAFGVSAGFSQIEFDPGLNPDFYKGKGTCFLANSGVVYTSKKLTVGISSTQLNQARIKEVNFRFTRHFNLFSSYDFNLSEILILKPQLLIQTDGTFSSLDLNLLLYYQKQYWIGVTNRNFRDFCFVAGIDFKEKYRIGYSYDLPISKLNGFSSGSHEIVMAFLMN